MLSLEDCLDFCDLDPQAVEAIAEHEHLPIIVAAELGFELLKTEQGLSDLHAMLLENIVRARRTGQTERVARWTLAYHRLQAAHPIGRPH